MGKSNWSANCPLKRLKVRARVKITVARWTAAYYVGPEPICFVDDVGYVCA